MREQRQKEAARAYLDTPDQKSVILAAPRFGKIKVALDIMKELDVKHVWILAPRKDIFKGWEDDMVKFHFRPPILGTSTFASIKKLTTDVVPDLVIIDEPHELSVNQQKLLAPVVKKLKILGLTGTLTNKTRNELYDNLNLDVCYSYSIEQAVEEGILTNYQIYVHQIPLDDKRLIHRTKKRTYTEKGYFKVYEKIMDEAEPRDRWFMQVKLINILQNSLAKMEKTRALIKESKDQRVLVFCGTTEVADKLGIPVYHSKSREKEIFLDFCVGGGEVDQLATIKMMQAGITINPINKGIVNYISGNPEDSAQKICRFLGFEYDNPDKKAEIHIVCSNEPFETVRLGTGLAFFDPNKISTIKT